MSRSGFDPECQHPEHYFLKKHLQREDILSKYGTHIAGVHHEVDIQNSFESLRNSELLKERSLVVLHNMKRETIWHSKLKVLWTNEFDLIVSDELWPIHL